MQLSEVLIDHQNFIHEEDNDAFTEFGLMVRDSCPDTLVEVLVSLIKASKMSLAQVLSMFISSFVSVSSLTSAAGSVNQAICWCPIGGRIVRIGSHPLHCYDAALFGDILYR